MASKNRYVDFVSDTHFLECVRWVTDAYPGTFQKPIDVKALQENRMDPFKMIFDIITRDLDVPTWLDGEATRQADKTINNRIGEFHQKLLGRVKGWINLGVGDESKVDLKKTNNSIFIELKNKFNTVNSDSLKSVRKKLEDVVTRFPESKAYWAYIIERDGSSGESDWSYNRKNDPRIRKIWGSKVYELATGDPNALEKVWSSLPKAVNDVIGSEHKINPEDMKMLIEFFNSAFKS